MGRLMRDSVRVEERAAGVRDRFGNEQDDAWTTKISAQPARITPLGGDEKVRADRLTGSVRFEVRLRYSSANAAIVAGDRLVLERSCASLPAGTELNIKHAPIDPSERGRWCVFTVESGVAT